jgi:hypothetical protein
LAAVFDKAMTAQRQSMDDRHEAARAALSAGMEQARHDGQRDVWAKHGERLAALKVEQQLERDAARARQISDMAPANQNRPDAPKVQAVEPVAPAPVPVTPAQAAQPRFRAAASYEALKGATPAPAKATPEQAAAEAARASEAAKPSRPLTPQEQARETLMRELREKRERERGRPRRRDRDPDW